MGVDFRVLACDIDRVDGFVLCSNPPRGERQCPARVKERYIYRGGVARKEVARVCSRRAREMRECWQPSDPRCQRKMTCLCGEKGNSVFSRVSKGSLGFVVFSAGGVDTGAKRKKEMCTREREEEHESNRKRNGGGGSEQCFFFNGTWSKQQSRAATTDQTSCLAVSLRRGFPTLMPAHTPMPDNQPHVVTTNHTLFWTQRTLA
jgi:hypothetical protein